MPSKGYMIDPGKTNPKYVGSVRGDAKELRAKISLFPPGHPGTQLYMGLWDVAKEANVPHTRLTQVIGGARNQVLYALASSTVADASWLGCGGAAASCSGDGCKHPYLHSPAFVAAAGECKKCSTQAHSDAHTILVCPNRLAINGGDTEFVDKLESILVDCISMSEDFMAALAVEEQRAAAAKAKARTTGTGTTHKKARRAKAKGSSGDANATANMLSNWIATSVVGPAKAAYNDATKPGVSADDKVIEGRVHQAFDRRKKAAKAQGAAAAAPKQKTKSWVTKRTWTNMKNGPHAWSRSLCERAIADSNGGGKYRTFYADERVREKPQVVDGIKICPNPDLDAVKHPGRGVHIINSAHPHVLEQLELHGMPKHVPCPHAGCDCITHTPAADNRVSTSTASPYTLYGVLGKEEPLVSFRSECPQHGPFNHVEHGSLARLPLSITNSLPIDCVNGRVGLMLSKELAPTFMHQMVHGCGFATVLHQLKQQRADVFVQRHEEYVVQARLRHAQLEALVGDAVWAGLPTERKAARFDVRVEYLLVKDGISRNLGAVPSFLSDDDHLHPSEKTLRDIYVEVAEARRHVRDQTMRGYIARLSVSLDHSANKFGGAKWLATLCNEKSQLLSALAVPSTSAAHVVEWAKAASRRDGFTARGSATSALVVDDMPTNYKEDGSGRPMVFRNTITEAMGLAVTLQDLFHCNQNTSSAANNNSSWYFPRLLLGLRRVVRVPVAKYFNLVKAKLTSKGTVAEPIVFSRERTFKGVEYGKGVQRWTEAQFEAAVASGAFHYLFTAETNVVPWEHRDPADMDAQVEALIAELTELCFRKDDSTGLYVPVEPPSPGKGKLFGSHSKMVTDLKKFLVRVKRTVPPDGASAYTEAREAGHLKMRWGMQVWRPVFHSSSNESNHHRVNRIITSNNAKGVLATALYSEACPSIDNGAAKAHGDLVEVTDLPAVAARVNEHHVDAGGLLGGAGHLPYPNLPRLAGPKTELQKADVLGLDLADRLDSATKRGRGQESASAAPPPLPKVVLEAGDMHLRQAHAASAKASAATVVAAEDSAEFKTAVLAAMAAAGDDVVLAARTVALLCAQHGGPPAPADVSATATAGMAAPSTPRLKRDVPAEFETASSSPAHKLARKTQKVMCGLWAAAKAVAGATVAGAGALTSASASVGTTPTATRPASTAASAGTMPKAVAPARLGSTPLFATPAVASGKKTPLRKAANNPYPCICKESTAEAPWLPAWKALLGKERTAGRPHHHVACPRGVNWKNGHLPSLPADGTTLDVLTVLDKTGTSPKPLSPVVRHGHRHVYLASAPSTDDSWKRWRVAVG